MKSIKIMPDYHCDPLWHYSENEVGNIDPKSLSISSSLMALLNEWAIKFDDTLDQEYPPNSGFKNKEAEIEFVANGLELAKLLKIELVGIQVFYYDITKQSTCEI